MEVEESTDSPEKDSIESLRLKINELEGEKKQIVDNFNLQRAKMKEIVLLKEEELSSANKQQLRLEQELEGLKAELDEARSQLVVNGMKMETDLESEKKKAQEEIALLHQLIHETIEESSSLKSLHEAEIQRLQKAVQHLEKENQELKQQSPHHSQNQEASLAPSVMLTAVTKTLARKLGAEAFTSQDSLEERMKRAQEDADVLRNLVLPLEEEIKALKDKLRSTDEQLQKCVECRHSTEPNKAAEAADTPKKCDMCYNYEAQLVKEQEKSSDLANRLSKAEKALERQKEDLLKEIGFRKDMEDKWNEKKEEHKLQVQDLKAKTEGAERELQELREMFIKAHSEVFDQLSSLSQQREQAQEYILRLQSENDNLLGKYSVHSQELQNEMINFPNAVEELQELLLKHQEDLITEKVGKESAREQVEMLRSEIIVMQEALNAEKLAKEKVEQQMSVENAHLANGKKRLEDNVNALIHFREKYVKLEKTHKEAVAELNDKLSDCQRIKRQIDDDNSELKSRISSLQQELDNSETVQKDFVKLSQSLQVELEKIRASGTQVRWQHEEDVDECPSCKAALHGSRRKQHCRHCGQIFCNNCVNHVVHSGPKMRPSKVCGVCHTLLDQSSAPYFSTEAPHSPR